MESEPSLDLEAAIACWREELRRSGRFAGDTLAELESHVRDAVEEASARGVSPCVAFTKAVQRLGECAPLGTEFSKLKIHRSPMKLHSVLTSPRVRKSIRCLAITAAIVLPLRAFAVIPYRVPTRCMEPEVPVHSHILVWKLTSHFASGDIVAFNNDGRTFLGRVMSISPDGMVLNRTGQADQTVPTEKIVGRVILNTR